MTIRYLYDEKIFIREYVHSKDFKQVYALNKIISPDENEQDVTNYLVKFNGKIFVLEKEQKILGFATLAYPIYNKVGIIYSLCIDVNYQNQGYGTSLIQYLIDFSMSIDLRFITVSTALWNWKLIQFYQKFGLKVVNVFPAYFGDDNDMVWLEKDIRKRL